MLLCVSDHHDANNSDFEMACWSQTFYPFPALLIFLSPVLFSHCSFAFSVRPFLLSLTLPSPDLLTVFSLTFLPVWCFFIMSVYMAIWLLCFRNEGSDNSRLMKENSRFWFITQETYLREGINLAYRILCLLPKKCLLFQGTHFRACWRGLVW